MTNFVIEFRVFHFFSFFVISLCSFSLLFRASFGSCCQITNPLRFNRLFYHEDLIPNFDCFFAGQLGSHHHLGDGYMPSHSAGPPSVGPVLHGHGGHGGHGVHGGHVGHGPHHPGTPLPSGSVLNGPPSHPPTGHGHGSGPPMLASPHDHPGSHSGGHMTPHGSGPGSLLGSSGSSGHLNRELGSSGSGGQLRSASGPLGSSGHLASPSHMIPSSHIKSSSHSSSSLSSATIGQSGHPQPSVLQSPTSSTSSSHTPLGIHGSSSQQGPPSVLSTGSQSVPPPHTPSKYDFII